jgi:lysyl-tRNA synthetase class 1
MGYWADDLVAALPSPASGHILATGISPSGDIHLGNLREVMTADVLSRVMKENGKPARFLFIADNLDPLRRVYPFLDGAVYEALVGQSLALIACPCGDHGSYSDHFLEPFLAALQELGIDAEVVRADELYASGGMDQVIGQALASRDTIASILTELTGKQVPATWSPFDVRCQACLRLTGATVTGFDGAAGTVDYRCSCGGEGRVPFAGGGKLTWRVDWPARWKALGVTIEPFGKDHASRGGSYDTGVRIAREVFAAEAPHPVPYEWIALRGKGDMSSSKGNVLSIHGMLEVTPPEFLRYMVLRTEPQKAIRFDPGLPLLTLMDELENPENRNRNERAVELARIPGRDGAGIPFRQLVTLAQIGDFDPERTAAVLKRVGFGEVEGGMLAAYLGYVRRWLDDFAPDDVRFSLAQDLPAAVDELDEEQKRFMGLLAERYPDAIDGDALHSLMYDLIQEMGGEKPGSYFAALYAAFIGKQRGPRAGHFLAALPAEFVRRRLREAAA